MQRTDQQRDRQSYLRVKSLTGTCAQQYYYSCAAHVNKNMQQVKYQNKTRI